jgi:hypothetical protein
MTKTKKEWEITIIADTNDGDYITAITEISDEDLEKIKPLIAAIKKKTEELRGTYNSHNYDTSEYGDCDYAEKYPNFTPNDHTFFQEYCPRGEYGFHTLDSIEITPLVKKVQLL